MTSRACARASPASASRRTALRSGPDCCSFSCVDGKCSGNQCTSDNASLWQRRRVLLRHLPAANLRAAQPVVQDIGQHVRRQQRVLLGPVQGRAVQQRPVVLHAGRRHVHHRSRVLRWHVQIASGAALGTCVMVPSNGATECASAGEVCGAGADYDRAARCRPAVASAAAAPASRTARPACWCASLRAVAVRPASSARNDSDCCGWPQGLPDGSVSHVTCERIGPTRVGAATTATRARRRVRSAGFRASRATPTRTAARATC